MNNTIITLLSKRNFLTPTELSEIFDKQISANTINNWIRAGIIPALQMGRKNLIPTSFVLNQLKLLKLAMEAQCNLPHFKGKKKTTKKSTKKSKQQPLSMNDIDLAILLKAKKFQ